MFAPYTFKRQPHNPILLAEANVNALRKRGHSARKIALETGLSLSQVHRCLALSSEGGGIAATANMPNGTQALARALASTPGPASRPDPFRLPLGMAQVVGIRRMALGASNDLDQRRLAVSPDPCPLCGVRGDYPQGCKHQRPDPLWSGRKARAA